MSPASFQTAPSRDNMKFPSREMGGGGFEPPKHYAADLQSVPFGHSGTPPYLLAPAVRCGLAGGAGRRTRTPDLLITNQLLYRLSYTSAITGDDYNNKCAGICQESF